MKTKAEPLPVFLKDNHACLFVHIPKCGGSSFEAGATQAGWKEVFSIRGINASRLGMFRCTPQHFHSDLLGRTFDFSRFDVVLTIVRHPFDRLKSEYYWQRAQKMTDLEPALWWQSIVRAFERDPYICDNHIRPQHEFLVDSGKLEIFALEQNGVRQALARLPGGTVMDRAKQAIQRRSLHHKQSVYDEGTERAFSELRTDIEAFYRKDMEHFSYGEAG